MAAPPILQEDRWRRQWEQAEEGSLPKSMRWWTEKGRAVRLILSAGNVVDITRAPELVRGIAEMGCSVLVADKGYDSDALRSLLYKQHIFPCLAVSRKRLTSRDFHRGFYRKRHRIENFFCSIKRHRRIATRYDKLAASFLAFVSLATILHWKG